MTHEEIAEALADLYQRLGQDDMHALLPDDEYVRYADALTAVQYVLEAGKP